MRAIGGIYIYVYTAVVAGQRGDQRKRRGPGPLGPYDRVNHEKRNETTPQGDKNPGQSYNYVLRAKERGVATQG